MFDVVGVDAVVVVFLFAVVCYCLLLFFAVVHCC